MAESLQMAKLLIWEAHKARCCKALFLHYQSADEPWAPISPLFLAILMVKEHELASNSSVLLKWLEWFQFPIKSFTELTIPDVSREDSEHLYAWAFVLSMVWLALFAYLVVGACDGIHQDFGISTSVLGYTVAAAGTSFPNVFSGICIGRQGKTTMAVANALGANVQNVFLALAIPWAIQCAINRGSFHLPFTGLESAVVEIYDLCLLLGGGTDSRYSALPCVALLLQVRLATLSLSGGTSCARQ
eukprot:g4019.t1